MKFEVWVQWNICLSFWWFRDLYSLLCTNSISRSTGSPNIMSQASVCTDPLVISLVWPILWPCEQDYQDNLNAHIASWERVAVFFVYMPWHFHTPFPETKGLCKFELWLQLPSNSFKVVTYGWAADLTLSHIQLSHPYNIAPFKALSHTSFLTLNGASLFLW